MEIYILVIGFLFTSPFFWLIFSARAADAGKREKTNWKGPILLFIIVVVLLSLLNAMFYLEYQLPIFPNKQESIIGLIITGVILLVFAGSMLLAGKTSKGAPSSHFSRKVAWVTVTGFTVYFILLFLLVLPTSQKAYYVKSLEEAMNTLANKESSEEFTVIKQDTYRNCTSRDTSQRCRDWDYDHYFYIRNNLGVPKEVQVKLWIVTKNEKKTVDSLIMKMEPGETRLVETEETNSGSSTWGKYTVKTELQIDEHDYIYRFRDIE